MATKVGRARALRAWETMRSPVWQRQRRKINDLRQALTAARRELTTALANLDKIIKQSISPAQAYRLANQRHRGRGPTPARLMYKIQTGSKVP